MVAPAGLFENNRKKVSMSSLPAGRGHAFGRLISQQPHVRSTNGFLSWTATFVLPREEPISTDMGV